MTGSFLIILGLITSSYCSEHSLKLQDSIGRFQCKDIKCPEVKREDCSKGYLNPHGSHRGCCPLCINYLERGESCRQVVIPVEAVCGAGLVCSEKTRTCVPPSAMFPLVEDLRSWKIPCPMARKLQYSVSCSSDGTFSSVQCSDETCYCAAEDGKPLGYQCGKNYADRMECVCARVEYALSKAVGYLLSMCDRFGNYKNNQ